MNSAPSLSAAAFPPARVTPSLTHAFRGILRLALRRFATLKHWLILTAMLGLLFLVTALNLRSNNYAPWLVVFLTAVLPLMAFVSAGGAMRDDLESSSVDYVLTRPMPRWAFIVFRYVAQVCCVQIDFLLAFAVLAGAGFAIGQPGLLAALPLLLLAQFLLLAAFSALGLLLGQLTSRYVVLGLLYGLVIELGVAQIPTQLSRLSLTQQVRGMLHSFVQLPATPADPLGPWAVSGIVIAFVAAVLALAAALFSARELAGKNEP